MSCVTFWSNGPRGVTCWIYTPGPKALSKYRYTIPGPIYQGRGQKGGVKREMEIEKQLQYNFRITGSISRICKGSRVYSNLKAFNEDKRIKKEVEEKDYDGNDARFNAS